MDGEVVAVPFAFVELAAGVDDAFEAEDFEVVDFEVEDFEDEAEVGVVDALGSAAAATVLATGALVTGALAVGTSRSATVVPVAGFGLIVETGAVAAWAPPASATIKPLEHNVTRVAAGATARRRCAPECFEDFMNLVSTHRKPRLSLLPFQSRPLRDQEVQPVNDHQTHCTKVRSRDGFDMFVADSSVLLQRHPRQSRTGEVAPILRMGS